MRTALFVATVAGGAAVSQYVTSHLIKTPMYNSTLSGQAWLQELLSGHPVRFHDNRGEGCDLNVHSAGSGTLSNVCVDTNTAGMAIFSLFPEADIVVRLCVSSGERYGLYGRLGR